MHRSRRHAPLICHCEEAAGRRGNLGKAVTILPGLSCIRPGTARLPRPLRGLAMTRQGGAAVHQRPYAVELSRTRRSLSAATGPVGTGSILTIVCAYRQHCAGRGMPLPYNGVCGRRWCPEICSCQWRSLTAATDAIGLYVLSAAGTNRQCLREIATGAKRPRNDNLGGIYHFNDSLYGRQVRRRARHASPLLFHTYRSSGQMSFSAEKTGRFSGKKFQKALAFRVFQCYNKDNL